MSEVLTIRDPHTGALLAEEKLAPDEKEDSAIARVYRKFLGPNAPEQVVLTRSVWMGDTEWAEELSRNWAGFGLVVIGPRSDPSLEKSRLVLARVSEWKPVPRMEFPLRKSELDKIKQGRRSNAIVPVKPEDPPAVGDRVTFRQSGKDPFGEPILVPNGDSVSVDLTEVRNERQRWANHDIYFLAWDPSKVKQKSVEVTTRRSK